LLRTVDCQKYRQRLIQLPPRADRQKSKAVAKPPGAVNVLRVAGIDEKLHAVALVDSRVAAPRGLLLATNRDVDRDSLLIPSQPHISIRLFPAQLGKAGQPMPLIELDPARRPPLGRVNARRGEAKEHGRRNQSFHLGFMIW